MQRKKFDGLCGHACKVRITFCAQSSGGHCGAKHYELSSRHTRADGGGEGVRLVFLAIIVSPRLNDDANVLRISD